MDARSRPSAADPASPEGTMRVIAGVPGLTALIIFSAFNNFLGGVL
ncbi:hypothetical protein [Actinoplanes sp. NPDC049599]